MSTLLQQSKTQSAAEARPTREQCIQEAGAVLARAIQLYVPAAASHPEAA